MARTIKRKPLSNPVDPATGGSIELVALGSSIPLKSNPTPNASADSVGSVAAADVVAVPDTVLSNDDVVHLGTWNVAQISDRRFRLRNRTSTAVTLTSSPWHNPLFDVTPAFPQQLAPGQEFDFSVRMVASSCGERSHRIDLDWTTAPSVSENGTALTYHTPLHLLGCLEGVLIHVDGVGTIGQNLIPADFGTIPQGSHSSRSFYVRNIGSQAASIRVREVTGAVRLSKDVEGVTQPATFSQPFRIDLDTSQTGEVLGTVTVATDPSGLGPATFAVKATVVPSQNNKVAIIGVYRQGNWLLDYNRDAVPDETIAFGQLDDRPLTGDWNGDGICDIAVWRPTQDNRTRIELRLRGENPQPPLQQTTFDVDGHGAIPVAADRNGDGKTDLGFVVPRPAGNRMSGNSMSMETENSKMISYSVARRMIRSPVTGMVME